ncbi:MAG: hypothetical protein E7262_06815 [Lachnospiraceae bacterium]|nr:hypothetical protein [Lachnospiraceae bacterium]
MKKLVTLALIIVVSVVCVLGVSMINASAEETVKTEGTKAVNSLEEKEEANKAASRKKLKEATKKMTRKQGEYTFTYRLYVDYLEYLSFRKGHDGEYTIQYTVNDEEMRTAVMKIEGFELFNCQPTFISHYIDIEGVTEGDVIEYTYSYMNYYMQYDTPSVESGVQIVE